MKALLLTVFTACLILLGLSSGGADEQEAAQRQLMRKKLEHSQHVLEGLSLEDFTRVAENARALDQLTEKQWIDGESDEYRMHLKNFRFAAGELERTARDKNLDGAALAYVQMTMSCVGCHKHLRDDRK